MQTIKRSKGHVGFFTRPDGTTAELFEENGELHTAPVSNVFDLDTGNRHGRWEAPARMLDELKVSLGIIPPTACAVRCTECGLLFTADAHGNSLDYEQHSCTEVPPAKEGESWQDYGRRLGLIS